ncbi:MAG: NAD(P)-dependent glycerol-3-phosphate dehydrogenase [Hyphomicrobiaceae bacterium]|nr:MAG: NAD(P)-dependent glycerol-3-phosphate dehydrogenase [Hyphomicrobiaceae bacterium]
MADFQRFAVLGGGAFGTALAVSLRAAGRDVSIWARDPAVVAKINQRHANNVYLAGCALDPGIAATGDLSASARADALLMAVPAQQLRGVAEKLTGLVRGGQPVIICAKGIEEASGKLMHEVLAEALPQAQAAVLSGPGFAEEIARGLPVAITLAATDETMGRALASAIGHKAFRPYWTSDVIGVELGGAVKNVLAIAAGAVEGSGLGASAHAALVTRGFAELRRLAAALGGRAETLMGLSGLGDLILTCSSHQSRNFRLGHELGRGRKLADILGVKGGLAEGAYTAAAVRRIAAARNIEMPICEAVAAILAGRLTVGAAIEALLSRPFKAEE